MSNTPISARKVASLPENPVERLSDLEKLAIAGAIKDTEIDVIKTKLRDGSTGEVDFIVRIRGSIQKGFAATASTAKFGSNAALCTLLKLLGIGEKKLRTAFEKFPEELVEDPKLVAVISEAGRARAAKYPKDQRGSVSSQVSVARIGVTSHDPARAIQ